ncbi:MAG: flavodoxin family protein, partial [Bacteroidales bacterium]|nr:flavodoxin family protein [Bacteroidales bacterium]
MKKILVIAGSQKKKGAGAKAVEVFKSKFDSDKYSFETVFLSDYEINQCKGCTVCFKKKECIIKDGTTTIIEKMKLTDAIVFATPIYAMNIPGLLKTFIDRISYMLHKPALYEKHSYIIVTTDIGGVVPISLYMRYMMNAFGLYNTGHIGVIAKKILKDEEYQRQISDKMTVEANKLKELLSRGKNYKPKFTQIVRFHLWKISAVSKREIYPGDYEYWKEKGWL